MQTEPQNVGPKGGKNVYKGRPSWYWRISMQVPIERFYRRLVKSAILYTK